MSSTRLSRRALLVRTSHAARGAIAAAALIGNGCAKATDIGDYRRPGDIDDTAALLRAAETGKPVTLPPGRFAIAMDANDSLPAGLILTGAGMGRTIIARSYARRAPFILHADSRSKDESRNLTGLHLSGLTFEDRVDELGYSEFDYMVMLNGVTGASLESVEFRGFRGDAFYLGSSTIRSEERHNRDVTVRDCVFDGINGNNRNAISILDCQGLVVERCRFRNVSRTGGKTPFDAFNPLSGTQNPGAIDIEPEDTGFARVADVAIRNNQFTGGGGYAVTLNILRNRPKAFARNILIADNTVADRAGGFSARAFASGGPNEVPNAVVFANNQVTRCDKPFLFDGLHGLVMDGNVFSDCPQQAELGYTVGNHAVTLTNNTFRRLGTANGYAIWIRSVDGLDLEGNTFSDCGKPDGSLGVPLAFVEGAARAVAVRGNTVRNTVGRTTEPVAVFATAQIDRASFSVVGNRVDGQVRPAGNGLF